MKVAPSAYTPRPDKGHPNACERRAAIDAVLAEYELDVPGLSHAIWFATETSECAHAGEMRCGSCGSDETIEWFVTCAVCADAATDHAMEMDEMRLGHALMKRTLSCWSARFPDGPDEMDIMERLGAHRGDALDLLRLGLLERDKPQTNGRSTNE